MFIANLLTRNILPATNLFLRIILLLAGFGLIINLYKLIKTPVPFKVFKEETQDDPKLISFIRHNLMKGPSRKPYKLSQPTNPDFAQHGQGKYFDTYFKNKVNGTFIEVGAYDGETLSNTLNLELQKGWTGLLIEPNPETFKRLISKNRKAKAIQCCLSDSRNPKNVSLRLTENVSKIINDSKPNSSVRTVTCYPLYSLMVAANLTTVDLLSIDLEGFEVKALETLPWEKVNIKAILIEYFNIPDGRNAVMKYMLDKNYSFVKEISLDYFYFKKI